MFLHIICIHIRAKSGSHFNLSLPSPHWLSPLPSQTWKSYLTLDNVEYFFFYTAMTQHSSSIDARTIFRWKKIVFPSIHPSISHSRLSGSGSRSQPDDPQPLVHILQLFFEDPKTFPGIIRFIRHIVPLKLLSLPFSFLYNVTMYVWNPVL